MQRLLYGVFAVTLLTLGISACTPQELRDFHRAAMVAHDAATIARSAKAISDMAHSSGRDMYVSTAAAMGSAFTVLTTSDNVGITIDGFRGYTFRILVYNDTYSSPAFDQMEEMGFDGTFITVGYLRRGQYTAYVIYNGTTLYTYDFRVV